MVWGWRPWVRRRYDIEDLGPPLIWGTHGATLRSAMLEEGLAHLPFPAQVTGINAFWRILNGVKTGPSALRLLSTLTW